MARFPAVGDDFGSYRITHQLGRGGMGVVFAAEQRGLGRPVALKVLAPELAEQPDFRARFIREATVLARLDSPHVVQIFDHGEHDGCLYIATQYVGGGDLSDALRRHGPMPAAQASLLAEQVAWALGDSHAAGVVHRDVKPSNVLLRDLSTDLFAYLCDFGIAQDRNPGLTAPGAVAGTFAYLAPERLRGEPATASADLYALGCVLWTSLIGVAPYAGSDVEIGMSHLNAPVPRLVDASPVARAVNEVLQRSMAKDPAHRYGDARQMRADLRELTRLAQATPHPPLVSATPLPTSPPTRASRPSGPSGPSGPLPGPPSRPPSGPQGPPPSRPSTPSGSWSPPPPWQQQPAPGRRRRTTVVVASVVAAVVAIAGGVAVAVSAGGDDEPTPRADPTSSTTVSSTSSPPPTSPTSTPPTTPTETPTPTTPVEPPTKPADPPRPKPRPFYPDVPPADGVRIALGKASLRTPEGWGTIDPGIVDSGVGARDYDDFEGYYSSVFIRRSKPVFPLTSIPLLKIAAEGAIEALDENDDSIQLESSDLLKTAWLDGQQAVRIRAAYYAPGDDLYLSEETWFAQRGKFLYRITFQHSRVDTLEERRRQIDPMVVSFRWS